MIFEKNVNTLHFVMGAYTAQEDGHELSWPDKSIEVFFLKDFIIVLNLN